MSSKSCLLIKSDAQFQPEQGVPEMPLNSLFFFFCFFFSSSVNSLETKLLCFSHLAHTSVLADIILIRGEHPVQILLKTDTKRGADAKYSAWIDFIVLLAGR